MSMEHHDADTVTLEAALELANVPILQMVLVHLTGDLRWLEAPFTPTRPKGMDDHDTGGLPADVQASVRRAAASAIAAAWEGRAPAVPTPDGALLRRMLSVCMGEDVPPEYAEMMRFEMGFGASRHALQASDRVPAAGGPRVLVVGGGASGICAAVALRRAGFAFDLVEKTQDIGGTWAANRYPNCGVDTPSHLYSYSFAPHAWPRYFARREDVHAYLHRVVDEFGIEPFVRLGTEVTRLEYREGGTWLATLDGGHGIERRSYDAVITAVGQLNRPKVPRLPGLESFRGPAFHSSEWPDGLDVEGRRVLVVGTGASAMQIVPAIADRTRHLTVFQRSPQWAIGNDKYFADVPSGVQRLLDRVPFYAAWYRCRLAWIHNDRVHAALRVDPAWKHPDRSVNAANDAHRRLLTAYIESELGERRDLLPLVLPDYPPFGKRMLIDNGWFRTMTRADVSLVPHGVRAVTPEGVVDDAGAHHVGDVLVLATGFEAQRLLASIEVCGRGGTSLRSLWGEDDPRAYLGLMVPGFPNFFSLYGPNSNLGHGGSWLTIAEAQVHYVMEILDEMRRGEIASVEVRSDAHDAYNEEVDRRHRSMIWSHQGMDTWYRNSAGRVVTNSPWRIVDYWRMTRHPTWEDLIVRHAGGRRPAGGECSTGLAEPSFVSE